MQDGTYLSRNSATLGPLTSQPPCVGRLTGRSRIQLDRLESGVLQDQRWIQGLHRARASHLGLPLILRRTFQDSFRQHLTGSRRESAARILEVGTLGNHLVARSAVPLSSMLGQHATLLAADQMMRRVPTGVRVPSSFHPPQVF